eukprot:m.149698 g.149698  ORF g.149698 m.149698 type:complete len:1039 (+) comp16301_c0_seq3:72-3188(+)
MDVDSMFDVFGDTAAPSAASGNADLTAKRTSSAVSGAVSALNAEAQTKRAKAQAKEEARVALAAPAAKMGLAPMATNRKVIASGSKECVHEVAIPQGYDYVPLQDTPFPTKMAKEYPFTLDPFQRESLRCIERQESVLVSAHTSAGKTVVAEYAIASSLRDGQRVIYTSPIKALSNQKYRELAEEFQDVGLMTGDTTINPTASCLVMTTEILRSMLYRGSEIMREVGWVVFDEIHYMRDKERGVVWEETIILLPDNVHYVFLSATIPNALQFAQWICSVHSQPCHVVYTNYRPTPLQHYIFPQGGDGLHLVVDEKGAFREDSFMKAMMTLAEGSAANKGKARGKKAKGGKSAMKSIISMIMRKGYSPCIVFSFSKRDCESYATQLSTLDFNTDEEKEQIDMIFNNAIDILSDEDKQLPQVQEVLPLLRKGIGIHHGGLLPLIKEVIEILFGEGLVKVLFATETFAMGLNMPARTVVFSSPRKFDGTQHRCLTSGEYIQMSGRAGRRGLDDRGIVILMMEEKMEPALAKQMMKGQADQLNSAFHLTYNMVLNLLRVEDINPEYMLERSFHQFQTMQAIPEAEAKMKALEASRDAVVIEDEEAVKSYHSLRHQLRMFGSELQAIFTDPQYIVPFLNPGRLIEVREEAAEWGWGIIVNFKKRTLKANRKQGRLADEEQIVVETLLQCASGSSRQGKPSPHLDASDKGEFLIVPMLLPLISKLSQVRLNLPNDLKPLDQRKKAFLALREVFARMPDGVPLLDPIEHMNVRTDRAKLLVSRVQTLEQRLVAHPLHTNKSLADLLALYQHKAALADEIKVAKKSLKESRNVAELDQLRSMKRVLRRLQFTTADDVIELKGRVACEVSTGDELLLTELIFNGVFNELTASQSVALLSCFVAENGKDDAKTKLAEELATVLKQLQETARRIAKVSTDTKLPLDPEAYVQKFPIDMMDVTSAWAQGRKFVDICTMSDLFEGSIIRAMRRLEELLKQMVAAAKAIGNTELENKFAEVCPYSFRCSVHLGMMIRLLGYHCNSSRYCFCS